MDLGEASGLYYYRLRYYDPAAGRFISRDPIGTWGDPGQQGNAQNYCGNNPVNWVDPLGDFSIEWKDGLAGNAERQKEVLASMERVRKAIKLRLKELNRELSRAKDLGCSFILHGLWKLRDILIGIDDHIRSKKKALELRVIDDLKEKEQTYAQYTHNERLLR